MTSIQKFWKNLEKYGVIKDSQFVLNVPLRLLEEVFEQAQEMHKVEIINAADQNQFEDIDNGGIFDMITKGEQYYQETYYKTPTA
jgi:hypothetical protein